MRLRARAAPHHPSRSSVLHRYATRRSASASCSTALRTRCCSLGRTRGSGRAVYSSRSSLPRRRWRAAPAARIAPGAIPLWLCSREPGDQAYFHNVLQAVEKKADGQSLRFCRECGAFKPDRCHHCAELGQCVLAMQHWSPLCNNAIGYYNLKPYLLWLLYASLASPSSTCGPPKLRFFPASVLLSSTSPSPLASIAATAAAKVGDPEVHALAGLGAPSPGVAARTGRRYSGTVERCYSRLHHFVYFMRIIRIGKSSLRIFCIVG